MKHILTCVLALALSCLSACASPAKPPSKRVLMLVGEGVNFGEYQAPFLAIQAAGYVLDVAGPTKGRQRLSLDGKDGPKDPIATITLDEARTQDYVGLVIPGGYSPGTLEKFPRALEICKEFFAAGKPVSAICHGPRLLLRANLLEGRVMTCLESVSNELADDWKAGKYGKYVDQAVVVDGKLTTSRYPNDVGEFTRTTLKQLTAAGGLPALLPGRMLVIAAGADGGENWVFREVPAILGMTSKVVGDGDLEKFVASDEYTPAAFDALLVTDSKNWAKLKDLPAFARVVKGLTQASKPIFALNDAAQAARDAGAGPNLKAITADRSTLQGSADVLRQFVAAVSTEAKGRKAELAPVAWDVLISLEPGFSDRVYAASRAQFESQGKRVRVISGKAIQNGEGWIIGKEGIPAWAALPVFGVGTGLTVGPDGASGEVPESLKAVIAAATWPNPVAESYTAAIALRPGFDDQVCAAMEAHLRAQGRKVVVIAAQKGAIRGVNGLAAQATATYADDVKLAADAIIVAPGGFYPQKKEARQAKQPDWIEQVDRDDQQRLAWLMARYKAGATVVAFGMDTLRLAASPDFKGKKFASTDQNVWSFGKEGGGYSTERATLSAERLITGKGADTLGDVIRLMQAPPK